MFMHTHALIQLVLQLWGVLIITEDRDGLYLQDCRARVQSSRPLPWQMRGIIAFSEVLLPCWKARSLVWSQMPSQGGSGRGRENCVRLFSLSDIRDS